MARPIFEPKNGKDKRGKSISKCKRDRSNPARYEVLAYSRDVSNELIARILSVHVCENHRDSVVPEVDGDELAGYDVLF